jgi:Cu+-exporting ATPase
LGSQYNLAVISGDNPRDGKRLQSFFGLSAKFRFRQSPEDKLSFVKSMQDEGHKVMMIGDGLNDAGALRQSDVAAVIARDHHFFTPASDIIMNNHAFGLLPQFLKYIKTLRKSLYGAFFMAFIYNGLGLFFAVSGKLTPIVAAILMPASSLSIVAYGLGISFFFFKRNLCRA